MSKPFSKLQREIYKLLDPKAEMQIHCRAYRMPKSQSTNPQIPRYWITVGDEIVFDHPGKDGFKVVGQDCEHAKTNWRPGHHFPYDTVPLISQLIRDYIDTPVSELMDKKFKCDHFGITDLLKAGDRRIGKRRWDKLPETDTIRTILGKRCQRKPSTTTTTTTQKEESSEKSD